MNGIRLINADPLPNIPWQDAPAGAAARFPVWRYTENPVTQRNPAPGIARIFNSAVIPWQDGFIAALRGEQVNGTPLIYLGHSEDGIHWDVDREPVAFTDAAGRPRNPLYAYDPRLVRIGDTCYIIWCGDFRGASIGMAETKDFKTFTRLENPFIPFNRNAVLFPRRIGGTFRMLSRPSDNGHTPFGDIFLSESPDLTFWGKHRHVMGSGGVWWQGTKIGAGAAPIETSEGWLLFYHGVCTTCSGYVYSMGGAILDPEEPCRVLFRCSDYLLTPEEPYETTGFVPNVVFPCAALADGPTGRIAVYYGAADTYVGLAFTTVDRVVSYIKEHSCLHEGDGDTEYPY